MKTKQLVRLITENFNPEKFYLVHRKDTSQPNPSNWLKLKWCARWHSRENSKIIRDPMGSWYAFRCKKCGATTSLF